MHIIIKNIINMYTHCNADLVIYCHCNRLFTFVLRIRGVVLSIILVVG